MLEMSVEYSVDFEYRTISLWLKSMQMTSIIIIVHYINSNKDDDNDHDNNIVIIINIIFSYLDHGKKSTKADKLDTC